MAGPLSKAVAPWKAQLQPHTTPTGPTTLSSCKGCPLRLCLLSATAKSKAMYMQTNSTMMSHCHTSQTLQTSQWLLLLIVSTTAQVTEGLPLPRQDQQCLHQQTAMSAHMASMICSTRSTCSRRLKLKLLRQRQHLQTIRVGLQPPPPPHKQPLQTSRLPACPWCPQAHSQLQNPHRPAACHLVPT